MRVSRLPILRLAGAPIQLLEEKLSFKVRAILPITEPIT